MADLRVELNSSEIRDFLRSDSVAAMLVERAEAVQRRCGDGYTVSTYRGKTRANASVMTDTKEAINDNLEKNTLLKALK